MRVEASGDHQPSGSNWRSTGSTTWSKTTWYADYQVVFDQVVLPVLRQFDPDVLIISLASTRTSGIRSAACA